MRVIWIILSVICLLGFFSLPVAAENNSIVIKINPIGDHSIGERYLTISGSTNHPAAQNDSQRNGIFVQVIQLYPPTPIPTECGTPECNWGNSGMIPVYPGNGSLNRWSFNYDMQKTGTFMADVEDPKSGFRVTEIFNVTPSIEVTGPFITIDPVGNHTQGEIFFINGTTDNDPGKTVTLSISCFDSPFGRVSTFQSPVIIKTGNRGVNYWSYNVSASPDLWQYTQKILNENSSVKKCSAEAWVDNSPNMNDVQIFDIFPSGIQTHSTMNTHTADAHRSSIPMLLPIVVIGIACMIKIKMSRKS